MTYDGPERRTPTLEERVLALEMKSVLLESKLEENTTATLAVKANTEKLVQIVTAVDGGARVVSWIGQPARGLAAIIIVIGLIKGWFLDAFLWIAKAFK